MVMGAEDDQLRSALFRSADDRAGRLTSGPRVLPRETGSGDPLLGLRQNRLELRRLDQRDHPSGCVVERSEVLRALRVQRQLGDGDDEELRT
jgi:hypothetical protein